MEKVHESPQITLKKSLVGFLFPFFVVLILVLCGNDIIIALFLAIVVLAIWGLLSGFKWDIIQGGLIKGGTSVLGAVLVMIMVGMLIGVWMSCGSVPAMLYYGLKIIDPRFFLPISFIICVLTSIATGTSWGTAGTMGIALIGVAASMGIPLPLAAGAIISGAHVGDKLSPLSDTTLLASSSANVNLFDHITAMLYTTVPISLICLIIYSVLGFHYGSGYVDLAQIDEITNGLANTFRINPAMLIPPLLVIVLSIKRLPAISIFGIGIVFSIIWAVIFQNVEIVNVLNVAVNGFSSNTGMEAVDNLLSRGGALSMSSTIYVSIMAGMFAGLLKEMTILPTIMAYLRKTVQTPGKLIFTVTATCIALMVGGGGQYCTLTLPGVAFRDSFDDLDIHPCVLSRTMEDTGTLIGSIIPWDVSAVFFATTLGVATLDYLPYAFLPLFSPLLAIIGGFIGYGVFRSDDVIKYRPLMFRSKLSSSMK